MQSGKAHVNHKGKHIPAKLFQYVACPCKFNCSTVSPEQCEQLFNAYWSTNQVRKWDFVASCLQVTGIGRSASLNPKKQKSAKYFLFINCERVRVCQKFFCKILGISKKVTQNVINHIFNTSHLFRKDNRGAHSFSSVPLASQEGARSHIGGFPRIESHYCRKDTSKEYLDGSLNLAKMYDMYLKECGLAGVLNPVKSSYYRHIFNTEFNIERQKPKNDLCDLYKEHKVLGWSWIFYTRMYK